MLRWIGVFVVMVVVAGACAGGSVDAPSTGMTQSTSGLTTTEVVESSTTTTADTSTTSTKLAWPAIEVLVTSEDGVFLVSAEGGITQLVKGRVAYAVDDSRGGLLFQVERGRSSGWRGDASPIKDTRVWWVQQGTGDARELLVPTPGRPHDLSLVDAVRVDGHLTVVYQRHDSTMSPEHGPHGWIDSLRALEVESGIVHELYTTGPWEAEWDFATGGGLVVADVQHQGGVCCFFLETGLGSLGRVDLRPNIDDCGFRINDQPRSHCALSSDGALFARVVGSGSDGDGRQIEVHSVATGELVAEIPGAADSLDVEDGYVLVTVDGLSRLVALADGRSWIAPVEGEARFVSSRVGIDGPVIPPTRAAIQLRADGLGVVGFGDTVNQAGEALAVVFGDPVAASGFEWSTPALAVMSNRFDVSTGAWTDVPLVTEWVYWGPGDDPGAALETPDGITIGSTVAELRSVYGDDLWFCSEPSGQAEEVSWGWMTMAGIPETWDQWWQDGSFGLSGSFDRNPEDPGARVVVLRAGWRLPDHMCIPRG